MYIIYRIPRTCVEIIEIKYIYLTPILHTYTSRPYVYYVVNPITTTISLKCIRLLRRYTLACCALSLSLARCARACVGEIVPPSRGGSEIGTCHHSQLDLAHRSLCFVRGPFRIPLDSFSFHAARAHRRFPRAGPSLAARL